MQPSMFAGRRHPLLPKTVALGVGPGSRRCGLPTTILGLSAAERKPRGAELQVVLAL